MGNKAPRYNKPIGVDSECPICGMAFNKGLTHGYVNGHIDQCMTNPTKGKEEQKRRKIQKEYNHQEGGLKIIVQRDDFGEQKIVTVKDQSTLLTADIVLQIQQKSEEEIKKSSTRDKVIWFNNKIDKNTLDFTAGFNEIIINRENLIQDSMKYFLDINDLRKELKVTFNNELSKDAGGLSREFFTTLMKELLSPNLGLFTVATTTEFSYKINEDSKYIDNYLTLYYFFGKILGKALFDHIPLNVCLNKALFKAIVGEVTENEYDNLDEFKNIDYNVYNSLKFFRDNDLSAFEDVIEQYFTTDIHSNITDNINNGENTIELIPGGSKIRVNNTNKELFIKKKCHYIGYLSVEQQIQSILEGFHKVIPKSWVSIFSSDELEAAICGNPRIDLEDWKANTEYKDFGRWSQTVNRFWSVMGTYNQVELANILQFCTGTSRVPLGGFRSLESNRGEKAKFCIQKVSYTPFKGSMGNLPRAHTCFNRLDLPRYPTYNHLKEAMDYIAKNEIRGFGIEE